MALKLQAVKNLKLTYKPNKLCKQTLNAGLLLWYIPLSLHFTTKASLRWGQLHRALGVCDANLSLFKNFLENKMQKMGGMGRSKTIFLFNCLLLIF